MCNKILGIVPKFQSNMSSCSKVMNKIFWIGLRVNLMKHCQYHQTINVVVELSGYGDISPFL